MATRDVVGLAALVAVLALPWFLFLARRMEQEARSRLGPTVPEQQQLASSASRWLHIAAWCIAGAITLAALAGLFLYFPLVMYYHVGLRHKLDLHTEVAYWQGRRPIGPLCAVAFGLAVGGLAAAMVALRFKPLRRFSAMAGLLTAALAVASASLMTWWSTVDMHQVPGEYP
jgi:hypothetical protein